MFDGLKDKLGQFQEDVEADAEASGAEAEASEPEVEASEADDPVSSGDATEREAAASEGSETTDDAEAGGEAADDVGFAKKAALAATGRTVITESELAEPLEQLELELLGGDVEMGVASEITDRIRERLVGETRKQVESGEQVVQRAIAGALKEVIGVGQFDFEGRIAETSKPVVIVFSGVNGVGKTTSIAKLSRWLEARGYASVIANGDTYRAGANEQVEVHADRLDTKLISHEQGGDPAAVIYDAVEYAEANDVDVVLGDTAGRQATSEDLMAQLEKIDRVVDPDAAPVDGTILTKADVDSQGGAAISIAYVTGKPILFLGTGQAYDDLERFDPDVIVDRLLGEA
ncbi:signal recognition particle-docking protein FtsY [Halobacteriales archaeon SW_12_69_24]|nr:MAG: signal recognition particle-docking protein FtsY [Halobacteriales archaeon SW_12_69_24]